MCRRVNVAKCRPHWPSTSHSCCDLFLLRAMTKGAYLAASTHNSTRALLRMVTPVAELYGVIRSGGQVTFKNELVTVTSYCAKNNLVTVKNLNK